MSKEIVGYISIMRFGAYGDGINDDSRAFRAALAQMAVDGAARGSGLLLPPGTYLIPNGQTVAIPPGLTIVGTGDDAVIKLGSDPGVGTIAFSAAGDAYFQNVKFSGPAATGGTVLAVDKTGTGTLFLTNVTADNAANAGVRIAAGCRLEQGDCAEVGNDFATAAAQQTILHIGDGLWGGAASQQPRQIKGTVDPTTGIGVAAPEGSFYQRFAAAAGAVFFKAGAAATAWSQIAAVGGAVTGVVNISTLATSGDGTIGNPWKGWDAALNALSQYDGWAPPGYYEINVRVDVPIGSTIMGAGKLTVFTTAAAYVGGAFRVAGVINGSTVGQQLLDGLVVSNGNLITNQHSVGIEVTAISYVSCHRVFVSGFWCNCANNQGEVNHFVECDFEMTSAFTTNDLPVRSLTITPHGTPGAVRRTLEVSAIYAGGRSVSIGAITITAAAVVNGVDFLRVAWLAPSAGVPTGYDIWARAADGSMIGKVGHVAAGTLQFDYTGQAGDGTYPPEAQRNFWNVNGNALTPATAGTFSNVVNVVRCNFNDGTGLTHDTYHLVNDGGNGFNVDQGCQFNGAATTFRVAGANPMTIANNYAESMQSRWLLLVASALDTGEGVGGNTIYLYGNTVSNGANAAVSIGASTQYVSIGNTYLGSAAADGGNTIIGGAGVTRGVSFDLYQSASISDVPGLFSGLIQGAYGIGFGVSDPAQIIDVGWAWSTRPHTFTAADGTNNDYMIGVDVFGSGFWRAAADVVITGGPTADYVISGFFIDGSGTGNFVAPSAGMRFRVLNKTTHALSFTNEGLGSVATNRILTVTGATVTIPAGGWASFTYDAVSGRYRLDSTSFASPFGLAPALVDAATVAVDCSGGNMFALLTTAGVGASRMIGNPSNAIVGVPYFIDVTARAAAGDDVTWDTLWRFNFGVPIHLSGLSGGKDLFQFVFNGSVFVVGIAGADHR